MNGDRASFREDRGQEWETITVFGEPGKVLSKTKKWTLAKFKEGWGSSLAAPTRPLERKKCVGGPHPARRVGAG